jgi:hypothetical protein
MIRIGINEFTVLSNETKVNEKGTLELHLKNCSIPDEEMVTLMLKGQIVDDSVTKILLFAPQTNTFEGGRKTIQQIAKDLHEYRKILVKFLEIYMGTKEIEEQFGNSVILESSGATEATFVNGLKNDDFVTKTYTGISKKFVQVCVKNQVFDNKKSFRLKLWRQSATKNFPKIPTGFDIWIEPMNVPTPKVVATKWDLTPFTGTTVHRLSNEAPIADAVPEEEINTGQSVFNEEDSFPENLPDEPSKI